MTTTIPTNQLLEIAATHGTPVYVYDANKIKTQYEKLVTGFSVLNTRIFYASKALTNLHVIKYINSLGCNIDCSSINEVKLALHAGVAPENVLYTSCLLYTSPSPRD